MRGSCVIAVSGDWTKHTVYEPRAFYEDDDRHDQ
jgi:hypothetical protein